MQSLHIKTSQSTSLPIWTSPQPDFNTTSSAGQISPQIKRRGDQETESTEERNEKHSAEGLISIGGNNATPEPEPKKLTHDIQSISLSSSPSSAKLRAAVAAAKKQKSTRLLRKKEMILGKRGKIENRGSKRIVVGGRHV